MDTTSRDALSRTRSAGERAAVLQKESVRLRLASALLLLDAEAALLHSQVERHLRRAAQAPDRRA